MAHIHRFGRASVAVGAALAVALLTGGAAATVPLHAAHRGAVAASFGDRNCAQIPGGATAGKDGWVFVLPRNDADFVSLTLTFRDGAGTSRTVTVPDPTDPYPDGLTTNGTSKAWVLLPAGWTLVDGVATVDGPTRAPFFNLTHTCPGSPTSPPQPSASPSKTHPSTPAESTSPPGTPSSSTQPARPVTSSGPAAAPPTSRKGLPVTGTPLITILLAGAAAIVGGVALLGLHRVRRRRAFVAE